MKLRLNELCEIDFDIPYINVLEIENRKLFSNIVCSLNCLCMGGETEEKIVLYDKEKIYDLNKYASVCFDIFNFDYKNKKISSAINKYILNAINSEYDRKAKAEHKLYEALRIIIDFINELDFDFVYNENITIEDIIKIFSVSVDTEPTDRLSDRFRTYIDVVSALKIYKTVFFVNVRSYFTEEEWKDIFKYIMSRNLNVLFVEPYSEPEISDYECKTVIDNDFCVYKKH